MSAPRLQRAPRGFQGRAVQHLDIDAIYAAVLAVQGGIVKKIAARCGMKAPTFYKQQERELLDDDPPRRPYLLVQILKQQAALESKPREEACAELICEAAHLGADVVWRDEPTGERVDLVARMEAVLGDAADAVASVRTADADRRITREELFEIRRRCRELRAAAESLELEAMARATPPLPSVLVESGR